MKKLIAILVVLTLVAGAAFAETTVSGQVELRWEMAYTSGADNEDITTGGSIASGQMSISTSNDDGTYGGMLQWVFGGMSNMITLNTWDTASPAGLNWDRAFAWWQPIPQVRFFLGLDGDGMFNTANLSRWGHHRMPRGISVENWDAGDYLIGNWDDFGAAIIITPMDELTLSFAMNIPWGEYNENNSRPGHDTYENVFEEGIQFQVSYVVADIGTFYLTYRNMGQKDGMIGFTYFNNSFVDGLAFELGGRFDLDDRDNNMRFLIGAHYSAGEFGARTRFYIFPDSTGPDWAPVAPYFFFRADVMPFYNLDFGTIFCNIRIETIPGDKIGWHVNPYLRMPMGGHDFRVGALISGNTVENSNTSFALATSMVVNF